MDKIMHKIIKGAIHLFCLITHRVRKIDECNIPKEGAYILCGNHTSNWDPVILISCTKRKVCFLAKEELHQNKFFVWLAKIFEIFPVKRGKQDIESTKNSLRVLKENKLLGLFPEGTRNGLEKNGKVKNGAAYLSLKTGVPVIPVGIKGEYKMFSKITLIYGKPLDFKEYYKNTDKEVLEKVSKEIMDNIIALTK